MKYFELQLRISLEAIIFIYICLRIGAFFAGG